MDDLSYLSLSKYLCKCKAASGTTRSTVIEGKPTTPANCALPNDTTKTTAAANATPKAGETPTGETTSKSQPIYQGPRGGQYHYSTSGKKVYQRKK
jgi:hypothetical protein